LPGVSVSEAHDAALAVGLGDRGNGRFQVALAGDLEFGRLGGAGVGRRAFFSGFYGHKSLRVLIRLEVIINAAGQVNAAVKNFVECGCLHPREVKRCELADEGAPFASSSSSSFVLVLDFCFFVEDEDEGRRRNHAGCQLEYSNSKLRLARHFKKVLYSGGEVGNLKPLTGGKREEP
jgi:hypothetical protein